MAATISVEQIFRQATGFIFMLKPGDIAHVLCCFKTMRYHTQGPMPQVSGIQVPLTKNAESSTWNLESTSWNPESRIHGVESTIQNPRRGIQNPKLSLIPLHSVTHKLELSGPHITAL